jgi:hypothetical protein
MEGLTRCKSSVPENAPLIGIASADFRLQRMVFRQINSGKPTLYFLTRKAYVAKPRSSSIAPRAGE